VVLQGLVEVQEHQVQDLVRLPIQH
jgi:hypothetical protein